MRGLWTITVAAVLGTQHIHIGALRAARRSPCGNQTADLETFLDGLSWQAYTGVSGEAGRVNFTAAVGGHQDQQFSEAERRLQEQATLRVRHFMAVADRVALLNSSNGEHSQSVHETHHRDGHQSSAYCPHHVPADDPYWQETEDYAQTHPGYLKCEYSDNCQKPVTNGERVKSIRRALKGSQALFERLGISSLLYGGSAIGQYRCGDVIPWDVDCDMMVSEDAIKVLHHNVFKTPLDYSNFHTGETSGDLASFGAPGVVLIKKQACAPFEVVDTRTGFFCDVFVSKWQSSALHTPWWSGTSSCLGLFPECSSAGGGDQCYSYPEHVISPPKSCLMSGETQTCAANVPSYLEATYGSGVFTPNKTISISTR